MKDLTPIFSPRSIAVVGASSRPLSVGWETMNSILRFGFTGTVYPVNPKAPEINGIQAYPSIAEISEPVDLAIMVVKRDLVLPAMKQCAEVGVKGVIVITAGFKELGGEGAALEEKITAVAREAGIVMVGPNCMGVFNTYPGVKLNATFARFDPKRGPVGFISQSGAMGAQILDFSSERHFGFSKFISIGNKSDIDENDALEVFTRDEEVGVIILYLESFADAARFREVCLEASRVKPVVVFKAGRSEAGAKAASSHTGALAGSDTAVDALLASCGALRVDTVGELLSVSQLFSAERLPEGDRIAMVTNAGGPGIIATDELENAGFVFPELEERTVAKLKEQLPPEASCANPADVLPGTGAKGYEIAVEALSDDKNIDMLLVLWTTPVMVKTKWVVDAIKPLCEKSRVPVIGMFSGASDVMLDAAPLGELGIPIFSHAPGVRAGLVAGRRYREWLERKAVPPIAFDVERHKVAAIIDKAGESWLEAEDAFVVLECYGLPVARSKVVAADADIAAEAGGLRYPLVMKVVSPDILHKSDAGGVIVGIQNSDELMQAKNNMLGALDKNAAGAKIEGFLLQEMAFGETELIVGVNREPGFGPLIMCGLGGVYVEVLKDIAFSLAPLDGDEPARMLGRLRSAPILRGVRGSKGVDIDAIADVISRVSQLVTEHPRIEQLDINPLMAGVGGCVAVDARIKVVK
ncbi:MAG TPA: acetate--CoA ligase family protein [Acidobacteriota bacterium]|nr:acetate--CoA ligase family protein [Acidobacteriota bacterium]